MSTDTELDIDSLKSELAALRKEHAAALKERDSYQKERDGIASERDDLASRLKDANHEARDRRYELKEAIKARETAEAELREQLETIAAGYEALEAEHSELQTRYETEPNEWRARWEEAQGKIRDRDHKAAFERIARDNKVTDPARINDLYALTGYKPDSDDVDEARLGEIIGEAVKARPWYVDAEVKAGATTTAEAITPTPEPSPAVTPSTTVPGGTTKSEVATPSATPGRIGTGTGTVARPGPGSDRGESLAGEGGASTRPARIPGRL